MAERPGPSGSIPAAIRAQPRAPEPFTALTGPAPAQLVPEQADQPLALAVGVRGRRRSEAAEHGERPPDGVVALLLRARDQLGTVMAERIALALLADEVARGRERRCDAVRL